MLFYKRSQVKQMMESLMSKESPEFAKEANADYLDLQEDEHNAMLQMYSEEVLDERREA